MPVRLLTSAKSREKGTDETLREIEATGLGRLSSFPSVNPFPPEFLSHFFLIPESCVRTTRFLCKVNAERAMYHNSSEEGMCRLTLPGLL